MPGLVERACRGEGQRAVSGPAERKRECRASISGLCLQLTEGFRLCPQGTCEIGDWDDAMGKMRENAGPPPRRSDRPVTRGRLRDVLGGQP